jgi:hypothetical protein
MLEHLDTFIAFAVVMAGVSLLITVMTQMASALLGLRGTNLRWGIATLLQNVDPKLAEQAARLSDQILNHRLISDSACSKFEGWEAKPAPAGVAPPPAKTDRLAWVKRGVWWFVSQWKLASSIRKEELLAILKILGQSIPAESMAERRAMLARLEAGIGEWFDAVMDRVSQRFLVHMRVWTAIFSLLAAFALHLDSFRLLSQFAADKELRDNLVATAGAMTRQAEQILNTTSTNDPAAFARAVTQLASQFPELTAAVAQRPAFASLPEIEQWLNQQLAGSTNQAAALNRLRQNLFQDRVEALRDQSDSIRAEIRLDPSRNPTRSEPKSDSIRAELSKAKFQLIPDPYHGWDFLGKVAGTGIRGPTCTSGAFWPRARC